MSGEAVVVLIPIAAVAVAGPILLAGAAIAGTALVAGFALKGIAAGVGAAIEHEAREARRRAEQERARLAQWREFEERQRQAMAQARERHEAIAQMQQRLMAVQLHEPAPATAAPASTGARAQGYVSSQPRLAAQREATAGTLAEIAATLDTLPAALRQHAASPIASLQQQVERYRRRLRDERQPLPETSQIAALKHTAEQSLAVFLERLGCERDERARRVERANAALELLLVLEQFPQPDRQPLQNTRPSVPM
ncbi:hypothetical protein [uncultured Thiodictyon sp.]|uniref:hypothetical protein n=1 Tax=uncultured Thiodictyon sp. TaxID=1846217 RepID=UPI0025D9F463|nr:hypothetical protein [uncultured Thiodictyon sp.]